MCALLKVLYCLFIMTGRSVSLFFICDVNQGWYKHLLHDEYGWFCPVYFQFNELTVAGHHHSIKTLKSETYM